MTFFCHVCETVHAQDTRFFSGPFTHTTMRDGFATSLPVVACRSCQKQPGAVRRAFDKWVLGYRPER